MSNQNDFSRRQQSLRDLFVKRFLLRHSLALVICFLRVDQVVMKTEGVVRTECLPCWRDFSLEVLVYMRGVMINHHHRPTGMIGFNR